MISGNAKDGNANQYIFRKHTQQYCQQAEWNNVRKTPIDLVDYLVICNFNMIASMVNFSLTIFPPPFWD